MSSLARNRHMSQIVKGSGQSSSLIWTRSNEGLALGNVVANAKEFSPVSATRIACAIGSRSRPGPIRDATPETDKGGQLPGIIGLSLRVKLQHCSGSLVLADLPQLQ